MRNSTSALPIGVFDSGVGGLTVWRELRKQLPSESFVYLGDTARLPYGGRSREEILHFVRDIVSWMLEHPVKAIVMACNTSSALALEAIRDECPVPILGLILPGARAAVRQGQRIGVWATPATANSHAYRAAIQEMNPDIPCWEVACPKFVPLIESGKLRGRLARATIREYLRPLLDANIDTLVYGCTHYPLLASELLQVLPSGISVVDPAVSLVSAVRKELECLALLERGRVGTTQFFVSGNDADRFAELASRLLAGNPVGGASSRLRVRSVCLDTAPAPVLDSAAIIDAAPLDAIALDAASFSLHAD